jgi:enoyl-CoA hydratase
VEAGTPERVRYVVEDGVATITMDDGKVNALSAGMLGEVAAALDRAEADEAVVVLTGRERTFSGGFDLRSTDWAAMVAAGARLAERLLGFPAPVVAACNGNAVAMGAFLLLAADHRIGEDGDHRIGLNEVAIGITVPWFGLALARHRLTRPAFDRCTITGALLAPAEAREAGFLDAVVAPGAVHETALAAAGALAGIDRAAHAATKLRVRGPVLEGVRDGLARIGGPDVSGW